MVKQKRYHEHMGNPLVKQKRHHERMGNPLVKQTREIMNACGFTHPLHMRG